MHRIGLYTIVGLLQAGVGIVDRTQADFLAGEAQTDTDTVLELEGRTQIVAFQLGAGERSDADTGFDIGAHVLPGELVNEYRGEGQAVVARRIVTIPIGVTQIPIASQTAVAAFQPAMVPVPLRAQTINHCGVATLTNGRSYIRGLRSTQSSEREGCCCGKGIQLLHESFLFSEGFYQAVTKYRSIR